MKSNAPSPSARKVWIEMQRDGDGRGCDLVSPSARKVWIEMFKFLCNFFALTVTFREEGVD